VHATDRCLTELVIVLYTPRVGTSLGGDMEVEHLAFHDPVDYLESAQPVTVQGAGCRAANLPEKAGPLHSAQMPSTVWVIVMGHNKAKRQCPCGAPKACGRMSYNQL